MYTFAPNPTRPTQCSYFLSLGLTPVGYRMRCHRELSIGGGKGRGTAAKGCGCSVEGSEEFEG